MTVCHHSLHQNPSKTGLQGSPVNLFSVSVLDTSPAFLLLRAPQLYLGWLSYSLIHMPDPSIKDHLTTYPLLKSSFFLQCSKLIPYTDTGAEGEGRMNWEIKIDIYTWPCIKWIASGKLLYTTGSSAQCSAMTSRGTVGGGWEGGPRGRNIYIYTHVSDSLPCTAETKATF